MHATIAEQNTGSIAVMKKLGFARVRDKPEDDGTVTKVLTLKKSGA